MVLDDSLSKKHGKIVVRYLTYILQNSTQGVQIRRDICVTCMLRSRLLPSIAKPLAIYLNQVGHIEFVEPLAHLSISFGGLDPSKTRIARLKSSAVS